MSSAYRSSMSNTVIGQLPLRERKKVQTRRRISAVALRLFDKRGFDRVPVAEIARQAEVSEATVFNYFPTKEDLVFGSMASYEETLLDNLRQRPAGTSVVAAFRAFVLQPRGVLASSDPAAVHRVAQAARIIAGSTLLQAREHQLAHHTTLRLAELIAAERADADDMRSWVIANALIGVNRGITRAVQHHATHDRLDSQTSQTIIDRARQAMDELYSGLEVGSPPS